VDVDSSLVSGLQLLSPAFSGCGFAGSWCLRDQRAEGWWGWLRLREIVLEGGCGIRDIEQPNTVLIPVNRSSGFASENSTFCFWAQ